MFLQALWTVQILWHPLTPAHEFWGFKIILPIAMPMGIWCKTRFCRWGIFTSCPTTDSTCPTNLGFVLRTDLALNPLWVIEMDNNNSPTEPSITTSLTVTETPTVLSYRKCRWKRGGWNSRPTGVLAHYIDFQEIFSGTVVTSSEIHRM